MLAITVFILSYVAFASYDVTVLVNGEKLECSQPPFIKDGITFVPMRDIFEGLGANVEWNEEQRTASASYKDVIITVFPDSGTFEKNGEAFDLGTKSVIVNDKIMLPLRAVAQSFGYSVMWSGKDYTVSISTGGILKVYFLDSGQADSIFTELPDGRCMLIDAAEEPFGKELESFIREKGYSHIDYAVATHPHSDHIGAMAHILKSFTVGTFYMPDVVHTTKTYERMLDALYENGCRQEFISNGSIIEDGLYDITVLSPQTHEYVRLNDYSAVIKLTYKDKSILFSADAEITAEGEMLDAGLDLKADILKIGHHGSASSTSGRYLDAVAPKEAVITVKQENTYGFPSELVLLQLESRDINVHRTDLDGTVTAITDGYIYIIE